MAWKFSLCVSQPPIVDGDEANPLLDQPTGHQAGLTKRRATVLGPQFVRFLRQVKDLAGITQDQVIGLGFALLDRLHLLRTRGGPGQRIEAGQQFASPALPLVRDPRRDDTFHEEPRLGRIAAGGKWLVARTEEAHFGEPSLRFA